MMSPCSWNTAIGKTYGAQHKRDSWDILDPEKPDCDVGLYLILCMRSASLRCTKLWSGHLVQWAEKWIRITGPCSLAVLQDFQLFICGAGVAKVWLLAVAHIVRLDTRNDHHLSEITISNFMTTFETSFTKAKDCAVAKDLWIPI